MGFYNADQNQVGLLHESGTFGATSGNLYWIGLVQEHDITREPNIEAVRYAGNLSRNVGQFIEGAWDFEGTLTYYPQNLKMLAYAMGSCVDDAVAVGSSVHTLSCINSNVGNAFTVGSNNPFLSFAIEDSQTQNVANAQFVRTAKGCVVDSFELSIEEGGIAEVSIDYKAQSADPFTSGARTAFGYAGTSGLRPFIFSDVRFHLPSGTVFEPVKSLTFSLNNNLEVTHYLNGSRTTTAIIPTEREITVDATFAARHDIAGSLYSNYFISGTTFNAMIELNQTGSNFANIVFSGCRIMSYSQPTPIEGINEAEISFQAQSVSAITVDSEDKYNPW